jgi:hypothetical protein
VQASPPPCCLSVANRLFTQHRRRGILRTSPVWNSQKFVTQRGHNESRAFTPRSPFVVRLRTAVAVVILKNLSVTSYVTAEISVAVGVGRVAR